MAPEATARGLYVLSDLHLAPPGDQCVFAAHEPLLSLLDRIAAEAIPQHVVLNGDVFDFLQIPGYAALSLTLAPQRMALILDALDAEPPRRNLVRALQHLTAAGHTLSCLPGNHDPELNLAPVQDLLERRLGSSRVLPPHAGDWRLRVAGRQVIGRHGHHADPFNAISSARMVEAQAAGRAEVALPPGSKLVCQVINEYRRAKDADGAPRFPFVDLLPSESAVVIALLLVDPRKASRKIAAALGIGAAALVRLVAQRAGLSSAKLSASTPAEGNEWGQPAAEPRADAVFAEVAEHIVGALSPAEQSALDRVQDELQAYLDQGVPASRDVHVLAGGGLAKSLLLRALGGALVRGRDAFRPRTPDALALDAMRGWGREAIAIAGHTHAAKQIERDAGLVYLNTGTWLDLLPVPADTSQDSVAIWLDDLRSDKLARWRGCPVARVDGDGARLLHWNGASLVPWQEGLPAGC